jgi:hypothetical protein
VEAQTRLICLTLRREVFVDILGPLEQLMTREKSPQVITQRLLKLQTKGTPTHMPAEVCTQPFFHHLPGFSSVALGHLLLLTLGRCRVSGPHDGMLRDTWSCLVHTTIGHAASMFGHPEAAVTHIYLTVLINCSSLARMSHRTYTVFCIRIEIVHKLACASMFALKGVWKRSLCMAYIQAHHQQATHHLDAPASLSVTSLVIPDHSTFSICTCMTSRLFLVSAAQASLIELTQLHCHMMQQQVSVAMSRGACMQQAAPGSQATPHYI